MGELLLCENCKFWDRIEDGEPVGACRRYAPRAIQLSTVLPYPDMSSRIKPSAKPAWESRDALFPVTEQADWCGEFQVAD